MTRIHRPPITVELDQHSAACFPDFGSRRNFWVKYDAFAATFDNDMVERLDRNLDVMLIFPALFDQAGLLSAINAVFIVVTPAALSASPVDETNHLLRLLITNVRNRPVTEKDLSPLFTPTMSALRQNSSSSLTSAAAFSLLRGQFWRSSG
ncbi:hypothetical protein FRB96_009648 [Tulasnella sp. 330]|nr:hypothetical protein FRB96_009648 [Tulasnella sp. 330]KAG8882278.1 hypothetical protein FRB98_003800 [Tulasnella sp. 332]